MKWLDDTMRLKANAGFWDRLVTLKRPIRRWKTWPAERRKALKVLGTIRNRSSALLNRIDLLGTGAASRALELGPPAGD
jgi:hypothetical protein